MIGSFSIGSIGAGKLFSQEARDYFRRLELASGGNARLTRYDRANAYLIDALKGAGSAYWDTMGTLTTLVAKGYSGLTIPLRDGMDVGTPVNLSSGNYNAVTGYIGDGSTMYIDSGRNNNADGQDDASRGVWVAATGSGVYVGAGVSDAGTDLISEGAFRSRSATVIVNMASVGYRGMTRAAGANFQWRNMPNSGSDSIASDVPLDGNLFIFARNNGGTPITHTSGRLAVYFIGPSLTLATMDTILTEFMARVAAA